MRKIKRKASYRAPAIFLAAERLAVGVILGFMGFVIACSLWDMGADLIKGTLFITGTLS